MIADTMNMWFKFPFWKKTAVFFLLLCLIFFIGFLIGYGEAEQTSKKHYTKIIDSGEYCELNRLIKNNNEDIKKQQAEELKRQIKELNITITGK